METRFDLGHNLPPPNGNMNAAYRAALADIMDTFDLEQLMRTHRFQGTERDRANGARWLAARRLGTPPDPDRIVPTNGTLGALTMLISGLIRPRGKLMIEALTYPAIPMLARQFELETIVVRSDSEGMLPDELEAACRTHKATALYCLATIQNPTTVVMPEDRKREIVAICRRHNILIFEDDIYSVLARDVPPAFAVLAPEISWYLLGLGKSMTVGLRSAYVMAPTVDEARRHFWPGVRSTAWMAAPLHIEILNHWLESGTAESLFRENQAEANARVQIAQELMRGVDFVTRQGCIHGWLRLPGGARDLFQARMAAAGVAIGSAAPFVAPGGSVPDAARIALGAAATHAELKGGLKIVCDTVAALG